ncbi:HNH endonuclease [Clostridium beijerinckii]|uniref:HNH endonuclease n=1 Tax=Clostridium beijerinckii TaxID=1520 RepID=UPI0013619768|nr:HNH endonuclease [Clostridium beijerinckii]MZK53643.1 hypothetical protein [Clostridium beijerinckii]MZK61754.1 hypothetical protein [Clostridium beijerinckii]MZK71953.1 hypothetical protein [Clostridium beijerinckii]MZK77340.1 hypothetical protein [Clostridium beijerinckii]MZK86924.1 hypothetical protein [Clostridium beijerinckii]
MQVKRNYDVTNEKLTKTCGMCGIEKPWTLEYFKRDRTMKSGLSSRCKKCDSVLRHKKYIKENAKNIEIRTKETKIKEELKDKGLKICTKCQKEYPMTAQFFSRDKSNKDGLEFWCKECKANYLKEYGKNNISKRRDNQRKWRMKNEEKLKAKRKIYSQENAEYIKEQGRLYREKNKLRIKLYRQMKRKQYCEEHADEIRKKEEERIKIEEKLKIEKPCSICKRVYPTISKYFTKDKKTKDGLTSMCKICKSKSDEEYRIKNKDKISVQRKEKYKENPLPQLKRCRIYRKNNRDTCNIISQRYEARKRKIVNNFSVEQWNEVKRKFDNKCAYCGRKLPLAQEHFVPVSKGGEYTINNIVPSCKSCNSSKNNSDFFEWYPKQNFYSFKREKYILKYLGYKENAQQLKII